MILAELLADLSGRGVQLWEESDQLRIRAPKGVLTASLRDLLTERKEEILSLLRRSPVGAAGLDLPQLVPDLEHLYDPFPLNDIQQAYWVGRAGIVELGNITTHAYIEVEGPGLDVQRLSRALRQLVERHGMLRAVVLPTGEQRILQQVPDYEIRVTDLAGLEKPVVESCLAAIREEMSHQVLPADRWPLFDIRASHLSAGRFRVHISIDLLITDFGSLMLVLKEWGHFYLYPNLPLPALEVSFRDLVLAEQELRGGELYRRSRNYWLERLDTLPPRPQLPLAKSPAAIEKPRFRRREQRLEAPVWQRLKRRAREEDLTTSGLLLAAFAEVLTAWSRSPRFSINLTQYNRLPLHPQINDIVGNSISITLLEVDNSAAEPFAVRARRLQQQLWRDLNHTTFSGLQVLRELIRRRQGLAQSALMPVVFTSILGLESFGKGSVDLSFGELIYIVSQTPQVWLDHQVMEQAGALLLSWDTVEELFPEGLLDDMFEAYCGLLSRLAGEDALWREAPLPLVPAAHLERRAVVNDTAAPAPAAMLHTLFADRVAERADAPAVITPRRTLSYSELFSHANRVARRLRRWGAMPDTLVAVVMEKGWEQIAGVLGILGAGAAYMPLDPELPAERLGHLLQRGEVTVALTQSRLDSRLAWPEGLRRLCVDGEDLAGEDPGPLAPVQTPDSIAYVLFTSGSTGAPKGAVLPHRGPVNTVTDFNQRFGVGPGDRALGLSALTFDLSVYDVFGILAAGGALVLPDPALAKDPAHWVELMAEHRVTVWNSVPTLMKMLVEYLSGEPEKVPAGLRLTVMSGDWIPLDLPGRMKALWPGMRVIGSGGPTETSIWNVYYPIGEVDPAWTSIPYGRPSRNQRYHVLDEHLEPRPEWVTGELWAEGTGLARGYWSDEELTRAAFITHPRTGARLYRTGDVGRWRRDGNLDIQGRADFQLKIGGHRIEPGEIEAALRQHPEVAETVVGAAGAERSERQLVAWVVPRSRRGASSRPAGAAGTPGEPSFATLDEGVILDPVQRIEVKLRQVGLRRQEPGQPELGLPGAEIGEGRRQAYLSRVSTRQMAPKAVPLAQLGRFLSALQQMRRDDDPMPKYRYPSAGSLYPVQTYLHVKPGRVEGVDGGVYVYDPAGHRLLLLTAGAEIGPGVHVEHNRPVFEQAAFSLFLISKLGAITPIYGKQLARDFSLLEAGYIGQLLMTSALEAGLGICPIGAVHFDAVRDLFRLDEDHLLVHSFLGGLPRAVETAAAPEPDAESAEDEPLAAELRDHLSRKLPAYMVPSVYVLLDALPLSPNGKVDRRALPVPGVLRPQSDVPMVPPRNDLERRLLAIVQKVLGVETVGIHHNFFEIGASSVSLVQIHTRLKQEMQIEIPIVEMFRRPTISHLAQRLGEGQAEALSFNQIEEEAQRRKQRRLERRREKGGEGAEP